MEMFPLLCNPVLITLYGQKFVDVWFFPTNLEAHNSIKHPYMMQMKISFTGYNKLNQNIFQHYITAVHMVRSMKTWFEKAQEPWPWPQ